jgi:restriction system protein
MPVPTYDRFIEPVLRCLALRPDGVATREVYDAAARALDLTEGDRNELLPSGNQAVYKNRIGWAHDRLKRAGYSTSFRRGLWKITAGGADFLKSHAGTWSDQVVWELAAGNHDVRLRPLAFAEAETAPPLFSSAASPSPSGDQAASPDDRLESAIAELRTTTARELIEELSEVSPKFFETIVLDVLHKMGYGASRSDLVRVGGSGDGGIDGVIALDRLGLEKVYVQAKRWHGAVGRPDVQAFYGALAGQRANKGVFITTSTFTAQALEFARSVERVVLVDGTRLAELMIDYEVGVTMRPMRVPKLDTDYFDEQ